MAYKTEIKEKAITLRQQGHSLKEIAQKLDIAKSTTSVWLRNIPLNSNAKIRLKKRRLLGQYKTSLYWEKYRRQKLIIDQHHAQKLLNNINLTKNHHKLILAVLFWAEGSKTTQQISFINSDPKMIITFTKLLRKCYPIDETKFRALLHAHEYHDVPKLKIYWSKITQIPLSQFSKTYRKPHTGQRKKDNYPGSLRIRYYDSSIARELTAIYNTFADQYRAMM